MKHLSDTQEITRRFNEDEVVWRHFEEKRGTRDSASSIPEELLAEIDWREANKECRQTRCVGEPPDNEAARIF